MTTGGLGELSEPLSGRAWSAEAARAQVKRRATLYASSGLQAGDLVFVHLGNCLEFFADLLAIWSVGACAAPIDPRLTTFEVQTLARAAAPRFSLWLGSPPAETAAALKASGVALLESPPAAEVDGTARAANGSWGRWEPDRDALVLFTSGSTGEPKGVVHTHRSLRARWTSLREHVGLRSVRRTLSLLPTHFGHGLICNALFPWLSGQHLAVLPAFRAEVILHLGALLDEHRITFMSSVPALWRVGLRTARPPRARTLERVFCGSAPLSATMWRDIKQWTGASVSNVYGITETASWLAGTATGAAPEDGLVGEMWGGRIAIGPHVADYGAPPGSRKALGADEPGRIWVSTPALMRGYLGRDDLTALAVRDGWLATGDIGLLDSRGRLHLSGREREEINRGGLKVYPGDVDAVIERCDAALDGCAFGYDDGLGQEEVGVAVVLKPGDGAAMRRVYDWARRHLAPHQMPRRWYAVEEIPRTSRGKLNRAQVAARCAPLRPVDLRETPRERAKAAAAAGAARAAGGRRVPGA